MIHESKHANGVSKRLYELEKKIHDGVFAVGSALEEINRNELYLESHDSFESYCKDRWGFSKSYSYQLVKNAKTLDNVSALVDSDTAKTIKNSHLSEISKAPEDVQADVVASVFEICEEEERTPTRKDFKKAVEPFVTQNRTTPDKTAKESTRSNPEAEPPEEEPQPRPTTTDHSEALSIEPVEPEFELPPVVVAVKAIKSSDFTFPDAETVLESIFSLYPQLRRKVKNKKTGAYTTDFEEFWRVFPSGRKKQKGKAFESWKRKVKDYDPLEIISSAEEYAQSEVGQGEFVQGPVPWLNGNCWEDDREAWKEKGSSPKTFSQQKIENTLTAAQRFIQRGQKQGAITHE